MYYIAAIYALFLIVFGYFSVIGIVYLKAGGRGTKASQRVIFWYLLISILVIVSTIVALALEYWLIP
ncbi:MAG: hypothetical protein WCI57_03855 [Candidatus Berkelbacteria bacterium]